MKVMRKITNLAVYCLVLFSFVGCKKEEERGLKIKYFDIDKDALVLDVAGATDVVTIKTNLSGVSIDVSAPWCKAKLISENRLEVKVDAATDDVEERKAEITLKSEFDSQKIITVSQTAVNDSKLKVSSATAAYANGTNGINLSIDNDYNTYFMSDWSATKFPFEVIYNFDGINKIDFLRYYPRSGGAMKNGLLSKLEIWYTTKNNPSFIKYDDYDFEFSPEMKQIAFTPALMQPKQIKFVLYQGYGTGTYAAIGEMEFFKAGKKTQ